MLILNLLRSNNKPLYLQIVEQIESLIIDRALKPNDTLPPSRQLATHNGISRHTVCKAYDELISRGIAVSSPGGYTCVRKTPLSACIKSIDFLDNYSSETEVTTQDPVPTIDFKRIDPDPNFIPVEALRKAMQRAIRKQGAQIFSYNNCQGYLPLRIEIAKLMCLHSVHTNPDEILITQGAVAGIELIIKTLIQPGKVVVVERPTYSGVIPILVFYQAQIIEIDMTDEGIDLDALEELLTDTNVDLLYTMPNFHNPTGITSKLEHREKLLDICHRYHVSIIEDEFEEELKYLDPRVPPLKALDIYGCVYYIGTFSKTIAPGLRTGWVIPPTKMLDHLLNIKQIFEHSGNQLSQSALAEYCACGGYQHHLKRLHRIYRKRMPYSLKLIRKHFPVQCKVNRPMGGYLIWCTLPSVEISEQQLITCFHNSGVEVFSGSSSFLTKPDYICFRISIAKVNEREIQLGIERLGEVLHNILSKINNIE